MQTAVLLMRWRGSVLRASPATACRQGGTKDPGGKTNREVNAREFPSTWLISHSPTQLPACPSSLFSKAHSKGVAIFLMSQGEKLMKSAR